MSHALEGLPEWRSSPSRSSEWGRRSDDRPPQDEQDLVDAISKRTRAHYSLADMSLDQLETFLQESDEEDYFQNVDDEEEYRKFLAAVQGNGGLEEQKKLQEKGIEESESEDEDADFVIEIDEALESDVEEGGDGPGRKRKRARGPVTRGKRRKRESVQNKVLNTWRAKAPLRPLLPYAGNVSVGERSRLLSGTASRPSVCSAKRQPSNCGFTARQIGQLYCLMHEHVQLLLQVYAMCILEPAMQQTAVDTHRMLMELVEKREAVLSWKLSAFPDFCFRPPYIHPSVPENEISSFQSLSSETAPVIRSRDGLASGRTLHTSSDQTNSIDHACESALSLLSSFSESLPLEWLPATSGPVRSLMDVAPLALVREFMAVVQQVFQDSEQQNFSSENRVPLFAVQLQSCESPKFACEESSPKLKRTMAAALVESTKKQTIAVVPKDIASAMERFSSLFNTNLFPRKAPPASAANRLLFTDVEDELLAMGLMTYNNDWKAIQERFLPSKSVHQIFVRQKNRSSARAPHNSIKAVRRMKLSPLTADEVACIEEALKVYKYDWIKVCRYCVPYRDPATISRQWRVAIGTQKSYKPVVNNREKRKLHDARSLPGFAAASQLRPSVGNVPSKHHEAGSCEDGELEQTQFREGSMGNSCNSPVTRHLSSEIPSASISAQSPATISSKQQGKANGLSKTDSPSPKSGTLCNQSKPSRPYSKFCSLNPPTQNLLAKEDQTVQLAPGLPPLKLPPSVRVLSHTDKERQILIAHSCN